MARKENYRKKGLVYLTVGYYWGSEVSSDSHRAVICIGNPGFLGFRIHLGISWLIWMIQRIQRVTTIKTKPKRIWAYNNGDRVIPRLLLRECQQELVIYIGKGTEAAWALVSLRLRAVHRIHRQHCSCRQSTHLGDVTRKSQHKTQHKDINLHWQFLMSHLCRTEMYI